MNKYKSLLHILTVTAAAFAASCSDDEFIGDRSYSVDGIDIESGDCIELNVAQAGAGYYKTLDGLQLSSAYCYSIRTQGHWMIIPKGEELDWVRFLATEGDNDSKFYFAVWPNNTFFKRTADFSIVINGVEQSHTFIHIEQAPTLPTFSLNAGSYTIPDVGGEVTVGATTNTGECGYEVEYPNEADGEWLTLVEDKSKAASFVFSAEANSGEDERVAYVTVYSKLFPNLKERVEVVQNTYALVLIDDFGYASRTATTNIWDQTNALALENWTGTAAESGWPGMLNGTQTISRVYACRGYILLGNGGRIGTAASPAFAALAEETSDVNVTLDCVGYVTEGGVRDYSDLYIGVWGPGTIDGATEDLAVNYKQLGGQTTLKVKHIEITNFPNMPVGVFPAGYNEWSSENARVSVRVNGATADTRIILMGGYWENLRSTNKYDSPDPVQNGVTYRRNNRNNRIGIDNFKVMRIINK
ncbi:MAG: BACON domain-containing protein [Muribaculaceae bacterium]|nr:BACON domain-containing protein [Muribaculaceae bacterium]